MTSKQMFRYGLIALVAVEAAVLAVAAANVFGGGEREVPALSVEANRTP